MKKLKTYIDFINESEVKLPSVDSTPDRIKDGMRWNKPVYYTKPEKIVYLKTIKSEDKQILNSVKTMTKETDLYLINPSSWLSSYMRTNGEKDDKLSSLKFKEFNIYSFDPSTESGYKSTRWFVTKQDAYLKGNLDRLSRKFGLLPPEEEKGPRESWAILSAKMGRYDHYSWMRNDGVNDEILEPKDFKKVALRGADRLADRNFHQHAGGNAKIYYDKTKFIADFEKLSGNKPNLN